ncbi:MAG TPA: DUF501 domain-containing protein [Candidatus Aquicultor sp.]
MTTTLAQGDVETIEKQLKRHARGIRRVASRCVLGCPEVLESDVFVDAGTPFPTLFWLSCPLKVKEVSKLEDAGWSERLQREITQDGRLCEEILTAHIDYMARRRKAATGVDHPVLTTGVGGVHDLRGVKCLHAHYAHYLATGKNPIGRMVDEQLGSISCQRRCDTR